MTSIDAGDRQLSFLLSFLSALPVPIISLTLFLRGFPETAGTPLPASSLPWVAAMVFLGFGFAYDATLRIANPIVFAIASIFVSLLAQGTVVALGVLVHRDFFSAIFQNLVAYLGLFLFWFYSHPVNRPQLRFLSHAGYGIFILFSQWIIMMGYAIVTRSEPRPIEALIYNSYNGFLDVFIIVISRGLLLRSRKTLTVGSEGVAVDGKAADYFLGKGSKALLLDFLEAEDHQLSCAAIQSQTFLKRSRNQGTASVICTGCDPMDTKATLCAAYRRTYNRIHELKKLLELLEIGTIIPPKNKMRILSQGWKLMLFEGVRIERRNAPSPDRHPKLRPADGTGA